MISCRYTSVRWREGLQVDTFRKLCMLPSCFLEMPRSIVKCSKNSGSQGINFVGNLEFPRDNISSQRSLPEEEIVKFQLG